MKSALVFCVILASAVSLVAEEQKTPAVHVKAPERKVHVPQQTTTPVRHLSDTERAELRRQLQQFNQRYNKRP